MSDPYLGSILYFAGNFAIRGYAFCQGQTLPIAQNTALFSILGTTYGGNGQQTFGLPDLRGRAAVGMGQGPGLAPIQLGELSGAESVTLTTANLPAHTHSFASTSSLSATTTKANAQTPAAGNVLSRSTDTASTPASVPAIYGPATTAGLVALGGLNVAGTIGVSGNGVPFGNRDPFLGLNPLIALEGVFPSRN